MTKAALNVAASVIALASAAAVLPGLAHAADDTAASTATTAATVAPLEITAERRTVNLQTAPVAASVINGDQLQAEGIQTLDDLQFHTPSLTVTDFGQGNLFNIRGIGKDLGNVQTPSGVVTYWDGIAAFPGFFQDAPYYDINNVQVLRGPQGTFAGQNATGGAVFITTQDPSTRGFSGDLMGQAGNYSDFLGQGFVNLPVTDKLALRVSFDEESRGTFYNVIGNWSTLNGGKPGRLREGSARIGLVWQPTDALKIVVKGEYDYADHGGYLADPILNIANPAQLNPSDPFTVGNDAPNYGTNKFFRFSANIAYTLPDGVVLRSITGYQYGITNESVDLDGTSVAGLGFTFSDYANEKVFSQELNLVSPDKGPVRWVAGLYYQSDVVTIPTGGFDIGVPPGGFDINITYHTPKTTEAVFGQVTWDLTPTFQIQAGARYTHSTFKLDDNNYFFNLPATGTVLHASVDDSAVTGKVALNWRPSDNESFYAFFAEGHKQNGINTNPAVPFGPEEVTDFEGGWKPTFFDGRLRAQIGGYYSLYRHFQLQFFTPNQTSLIQNVQGTTVIYGLEAETQAVFGPLSFDGGVSYEHSRLGAALISDPSSTPAGTLVQLGGRPLPLAPEWTFNIGAQYAFKLWNGATLTPDIEYSYLAGEWDTPFHHFGEYLNPRNIVNGQLVFAQDDWKVSFYINNATDLHYIASINAGLPFELRYAGPPRQYGFRLEKKF